MNNRSDRFIPTRDQDAASAYTTKCELFPSKLEFSPSKLPKQDSQNETPEQNSDNKKMQLAMMHKVMLGVNNEKLLNEIHNIEDFQQR
jgi:hypothetical protein